MTFITLPGVGGSGESHWQTLWERSDRSIKRFQPSDWDRPQLADWCNALQNAVDAAEQPIVVIAHSLSCLLLVHWAARSPSSVAGAMLVAVPDPDAAGFPAEANSFRSVPAGTLRFPSIIVASTNDPYAGFGYAQRRATEWNSRLVNVGARGHINTSSNLGNWPAGRTILTDFANRLQ